ncbi:MAG: 3-hydroxyacyl-CoA dehydrogenase [Clostridiales bacterium]|nr:3-hydroxyacyl-CoA dehydrogenase [Clostridiales bacterium]
MDGKKIVVAGGGVLGTQIAFQVAYCGFDVTVWLRSEGSIGRTQPKLDAVYNTYLKTIEMMDTPEGKSPFVWARGIADVETFDKGICLEKAKKAYESIKIELDMAKAVQDADLVIESMAEIKDDKIAFYQSLAPLIPEKTILVTNSSSMLPSTFTEYTGRPEKYLALHFANEIWRHNTAEVMLQEKTDLKYFNEVIEFAKQIRMVPLPIKKEKAGYLLNSLLIPFLDAAMDLYATGVSEPEVIDMAWKLGTGAPAGPFQILDIVGLTTAVNISSAKAAHPEMVEKIHYEEIVKLLKEYIDEGKLGRSAGEGFYKYK